MLKSKFALFVLGGILGVAAGAGAMLIAFPFVFPPPIANDAAPNPANTATAEMITFKFDETAPGRDPVHWANGNGAIIRTTQGAVLRFNADFEAGPGPNFWIYLNTRALWARKKTSTPTPAVCD